MLYTLWRSCPEDKAVSWINILWICPMIENFRKDRVYVEFSKVRGKQLYPLLLVSLFAMASVACLDLFLLHYQITKRVLVLL